MSIRLSIELSDNEAAKLRDEAGRLGISMEDLARAYLSDTLSRQDDDFRRAAEYVLKKNAELYRRLS